MNRNPREPGLWWPALWRLAVAGATFILVYGACNRITAARTDRGTVMWDWERHIPFIREFVVPYWSLDLFFCGAFFLCASKLELNLLTKRLVAVTLASGACFLAFPLEMSLPRPEPSGWTAPLFHALYANDMPYNLAPSLHISLRSLIWICYGAHLTGWLRRITKLWFIAIGASTILVRQHHVFDVATGFAMGWLIAAVFRDPRIIVSRNPSRRLATRYAIGAAACGLLAWAWIGFLWPAAALGIVALSYATGDARLLGKENGTLSPSAEWCLLPVILMRRFIQRRWRSRQPFCREISPGVFFGRVPTDREARQWIADAPPAVLDLTSESNAPTAFREHAVYQNLPLPDLVPPTEADIGRALAFIRAHSGDRRVFIHCQLGLGRSARIAARWLVDCGAAPTTDAAFRQLRALDPLIPDSVARGG